MTRERPIIFSGESARSIIAGEKSQTRRIIRPLPNGLRPNCYVGRNGERWSFTGGDRQGDVHGLRCPYGADGDRLWVRETWQYDPAGKLPIIYRAANPEGYAEMPGHLWRSPIFMPRRASRIDLEVLAVRVERLQEISEEDAAAEGCDPLSPSMTWAEKPICTARDVYEAVWDAINGKRASWKSNPWCWALSFCRVKP